MVRKLTNEEFIQRARGVHGEKYKYDAVAYQLSHDPVTITCPVHGNFEQTPNGHLNGREGCPGCRADKWKIAGKAKFIERATKVHQVKFDYSKVIWNGHRCKVIITCPDHGDFTQTPRDHISGRNGCKSCVMEAKQSLFLKSTEQFIEDAIKVHGKKYDYSKVEYKGAFVNVIITCPEHGDFEQHPSNHLAGKRCSKCSGILVTDTESFIEKASRVHEGKYSYPRAIYTTDKGKVTVTCPEHGDFIQVSSNHLQGCGCPECGKNGHYNPNITGFLYILKIDNDLMKVGITNKPEQRLKDNKRNINGVVEQIYLFEFSDGHIPLLLEKEACSSMDIVGFIQNDGKVSKEIGQFDSYVIWRVCMSALRENGIIVYEKPNDKMTD